MSADYVAPCWNPIPAPPATMAQIIARVAEKHGLTAAELKSERRARHIFHPRQEAMHEMHAQKRWSLPQIGRSLGGRDHTTVLYGVRAHAARLAAK